MRRVRDALMVVAVALRLLGVRLGLWLLPFAYWRSRLARMTQTRTENGAGSAEVRRLLRAVRTASRLIPRATCLTQAIAAYSLLEAHHIPVQLRIGVLPQEQAPLLAHAWLVQGDQVVLGDHVRLSEFAVLPSIPAKLMHSIDGE